MTQNTERNLTPAITSEPGKIQDHFDLFQTDTYQDLFEYKRQFEGAHSKEEVAENCRMDQNPGIIVRKTLIAKP